MCVPHSSIPPSSRFVCVSLCDWVSLFLSLVGCWLLIYCSRPVQHPFCVPPDLVFVEEGKIVGIVLWALRFSKRGIKSKKNEKGGE